MSVTTNFDRQMTLVRLARATDNAIKDVSKQVLKDCNYYCKQDQGVLVESSETHSYLEKGLLIWQEPYARKQYYLRTTSKQPNINAEWMWCHKAKSVNKEEWQRVMQNAMRQFGRN